MKEILSVPPQSESGVSISGKLLVETSLRHSRDKKFLRSLTYLMVVK
jgi:hypothetical protein